MILPPSHNEIVLVETFKRELNFFPFILFFFLKYDIRFPMYILDMVCSAMRVCPFNSKILSFS